MKISVILQDDSGRKFSGEAILIPVDGADASVSNQSDDLEGRPPSKTSQALCFDLPLRALVKQHAGGKSGAEKFALLLACMTKGDTSTTIVGSDLEKQWGNMTALMGPYNRAHATRAKENGWVDSPKWGTYRLLPGWIEVIAGSRDEEKDS